MVKVNVTGISLERLDKAPIKYRGLPVNMERG